LLTSPEESAEQPEEDLPAGSVARGGRRGASVSWPEALRAVRGWLEPWIMLWRYWGAFSDLPPPKELGVLLERVFSGREIYLYVR